MKIKLVRGCVCDCFEADGQPMNSLPIETLRKIANKVIEMADETDLIWLISDIVESKGKHKHMGTCDCCGDSINKWTMEINDED